MGLFSKKISADKIVESLISVFEVSEYNLVKAIKETDKETIINDEQGKEIMMVAMLAVMHGTIMAFGDPEKEESKYIIGKVQHDVSNNYFPDQQEKETFMKSFHERCNEYYEVIKPENKGLALQFGQIFCDHIYNKKEDGSHLSMMLLVGSVFLRCSIEVKKFLDEIISQYKII